MVERRLPKPQAWRLALDNLIHTCLTIARTVSTRQPATAVGGNRAMSLPAAAVQSRPILRIVHA